MVDSKKSFLALAFTSTCLKPTFFSMLEISTLYHGVAQSQNRDLASQQEADSILI
jgi:hypothetical protein